MIANYLVIFCVPIRNMFTLVSHCVTRIVYVCFYQVQEASERDRQIHERMKNVNQQKAAERRASQTDESVTKKQWVSIRRIISLSLNVKNLC